MESNDPRIITFFNAYFKSKVWKYRTFWRGVSVMKCPLDLWMYQQLIYQVRPDLIIEFGTYVGGAALFFADMQRLSDLPGNVITVDVMEAEERPDDPAITYLRGSSTSYKVLGKIRERAADADVVMIIADGCHEEKHVLRELKLYHKMITPGSYFIVEDSAGVTLTNKGDLDGGPMHAIPRFLANHPQFEQDKECEQFLMTFNPGGYLRRKK